MICRLPEVADVTAANENCEEEVMLSSSRFPLPLSRMMDPSSPITRPGDAD
jgi:hypothetical protein